MVGRPQGLTPGLASETPWDRIRHPSGSPTVNLPYSLFRVNSTESITVNSSLGVILNRFVPCLPCRKVRPLVGNVYGTQLFLEPSLGPTDLVSLTSSHHLWTSTVPCQIWPETSGRPRKLEIRFLTSLDLPKPVPLLTWSVEGFSEGGGYERGFSLLRGVGEGVGGCRRSR